MNAPTPFLGLGGASNVSVPGYAGTPGPGAPPNPWKVNGATVYYDEGGALLPDSVTGGTKGKGTINAQGIYQNGVPVLSSGGPPSGPAGGDLEGSFYPDPVIKPDVSLTGVPKAPAPSSGVPDQIATLGWTNSQIAAAIAALPPLPTTLPPSGPAGGDLAGSYPNPAIKPSATNGQVLTTVAGVSAWATLPAYPTTLPPNGPAGGDLAGTYPNPLLKPSANNGWLMTTVGGVSAWAAPPSTAPSGPASGDLTGTYPGPTIKANVNLPGNPTTQDPVSTSNDATVPTTRWVKANAGGKVFIGVTAPPSPPVGLLWWNDELGTMLIFYDDGNSQQWVPASPAAGSGQVMPPGSIISFAGATAPTGYLMCDGSAVSRTVYAALYAAIGVLYGAGDGSTTFNVPDCRGRTIIGVDPGGTAGRVTTAGSGVAGQTVGASGGSQSTQQHAHSAGSLIAANHIHGASGAGEVGNNLFNGTSRAVGTADGTNAGNFQGVAVTVGGSGSLGVSGSTDVTGAGGSQNMPPVIVMNKIIKF